MNIIPFYTIDIDDDVSLIFLHHLNRMFHLPREIVTKIFEFDPTYHRIHRLLCLEIYLLEKRKQISDVREDLANLQRLEKKTIHPAWIRHRLESLGERIRKQIRTCRIDFKKCLLVFDVNSRVKMHKTHTKIVEMMQ